PVPAHSEVFQYLGKSECHLTNGTEKVRYVQRYIYNRVEFARFESDLGDFVGFTPWGEKNARHWNSLPERLAHKRGQVDTFCRHNYVGVTPFSADR
ncbi:HB2D protein, partial [Malurus elegans]|nr:HB2D protein [Malurus elegans]